MKCFTCVDDLLLIINLALRHFSSYDVPLQNKRSDGARDYTPPPPPTTICLLLYVCACVENKEKHFKREISGETFILILVYQINCSQLQYSLHVYLLYRYSN